MIGQFKFCENLEKMLESGKFPRFIILVGLNGSGKKTMANYIANRLEADAITYSTGVDDMRTMIGHANKITSTKVFIMPDADNMSPAAKNCILKVVEEPPQNAHFIMTVEDINNVLETIRSRGTVMYMDKYSPEELVRFAKEEGYTPHDDEISIIGNVCETPGDVVKLASYGAIKFNEYVLKVLDNLETVSVANMFKIANQIKLKETQDGYDVRLFWRMFIDCCIDRLRYDPLKYSFWVRLTNKKLQELQITGVNKQALFDSWLTDIKENL